MQGRDPGLPVKHPSVTAAPCHPPQRGRLFGTAEGGGPYGYGLIVGADAHIGPHSRTPKDKPSAMSGVLLNRLHRNTVRTKRLSD